MTARHLAHYFSNESHVRSPLLLSQLKNARSRNIHGVKYAALEIRKDVSDLKALRNTRLIEYIAEDMNLQVIPVYHLMTGRRLTQLCPQTEIVFRGLQLGCHRYRLHRWAFYTQPYTSPCTWRAKEEIGLCPTRCKPHFPCTPGRCLPGGPSSVNSIGVCQIFRTY